MLMTDNNNNNNKEENIIKFYFAFNLIGRIKSISGTSSPLTQVFSELN